MGAELRFFSILDAMGAFIQLDITMSAAKVTSASGADHKTHPNSIGLFTDITVFFSFGLWHGSAPLG